MSIRVMVWKYDGLLEYCKLDTQAMIDVLKVLRSAASG